jgi:hypothetical protein
MGKGLVVLLAIAFSLFGLQLTPSVAATHIGADSYQIIAFNEFTNLFLSGKTISHRTIPSIFIESIFMRNLIPTEVLPGYTADFKPSRLHIVDSVIEGRFDLNTNRPNEYRIEDEVRDGTYTNKVYFTNWLQMEFESTKFLNVVSLAEVCSSKGIVFTGCEFLDQVHIAGGEFGERMGLALQESGLHFKGCDFKEPAWFIGVTFNHGNPDLSSAIFRSTACFDHATFKRPSLVKTTFADNVSFVEALFVRGTIERTIFH